MSSVVPQLHTMQKDSDIIEAARRQLEMLRQKTGLPGKKSKVAYTFPAGEYYVGDLGYVFGHDVWHEMCDEFTTKSSSAGLPTGCYKIKRGDHDMYFYNSSVPGDGDYYDQDGREYPVDSSSIGCVNVDEIDMKLMKSYSGGPVGYIIDFQDEFTCEEEDNEIMIGDEVSIRIGKSKHDGHNEDEEGNSDEDEERRDVYTGDSDEDDDE